MQKLRAELRQTFFVVTLLALSQGCSSSTDGGTDVDGGSDGIVADEGACDAATKPACCCEGDLAAFPVCSAAGTFVCPAGTSAYTAEECTRPCGPCRLPCHDTGVAETTSDADADADADSVTGSDVGTCGAPAFCCCDGTDLTASPICSEAGAPMCPGGFREYFGDDCTRGCGPCTFAPSCVDTGVDGG